MLWRAGVNDELNVHLRKVCLAEIFSEMEKSSPHTWSETARLSSVQAFNPTLMLGWTTYRHQVRRLDAFHFKCLRSILGVCWRDGLVNNNTLQGASMLDMWGQWRKWQLRPSLPVPVFLIKYFVLGRDAEINRTELTCTQCEILTFCAGWHWHISRACRKTALSKMSFLADTTALILCSRPLYTNVLKRNLSAF